MGRYLFPNLKRGQGGFGGIQIVKSSDSEVRDRSEFKGISLSHIISDIVELVFSEFTLGSSF